MKAYIKIMDVIYDVCQKLALVFLVACMTLLFVQTVLRFTMNISLSWAEELCRYFAIWMTFLGSGIGIRKGIHVGFDILKNKLKGKVQTALLTILNAIVFLFSFVLLSEGLALMKQSANQTSASLGFSMTYVYSALVVGAVLFILFSLEGVVRRVVKEA